MASNMFRIREGMEVVGSTGEKLGRVGRVMVGGSTRQPRFFTIEKGLLFTKDYIVPREAITRVEGDRLVIPLQKDQIQRLPEYQNRAPTQEEVSRAYELLGARRSEAWMFQQPPWQQGMAGTTTPARGTSNLPPQRPYYATSEEFLDLTPEERERQGYRSEWDYGGF